MASSMTSRKALLLAATLTPVVLAASTPTSTFNYATEPAYTEGCHADNPLYSNPAFAASCYLDSQGGTSLPPVLSSELTAYEATASASAPVSASQAVPPGYTGICNPSSPGYSSMALNNQTFNSICASQIAAAATVGCHASNPLYTNPAFAYSCCMDSKGTDCAAILMTSTMASMAGGSTPVVATATMTSALTAFTGAAASRGVGVEAAAAAGLLGLVGVVLL